MTTFKHGMHSQLEIMHNNSSSVHFQPLNKCEIEKEPGSLYGRILKYVMNNLVIELKWPLSTS